MLVSLKTLRLGKFELNVQMNGEFDIECMGYLFCRMVRCDWQWNQDARIVKILVTEHQ